MILLTGATGFLGSGLLASLLDHGHEVVAMKRSFSAMTRIESRRADPKLHLLDIDRSDLTKVFDRFAVDTIVHTATDYGRGSAPIGSILDANLVLPLRLAELGLRNGVRCFVNSDSFFNKRGNVYAHLLNYSLSKASLRRWLCELAGQMSVINVVLEHLYGPGDSPAKFVESVIQQIAVKRAPHIALTDGLQRRDFVHIDDVVAGYLKLIEHGRSNGIGFDEFELGTGHATSLRDFVGLVKELSASPTDLRFGELPNRPDEIMVSTADTRRLLALGWQATLSPRDGLRRTLAAYGTCSA
jgi:nucleoside-diphosphate-sugar epimerase